MLYVYRLLWSLHLEWLLVCLLYKEVYLQTFKCVSFWIHGCCRKWEGWARTPVNHISWVAVVTTTDRPKSVRSRCVIELFVALFVLSLCPFDISAGEGAFVIGLSQISSFSLDLCVKTLGQGHDPIVWYIIKIQHGSQELRSGHGFGYVWTVTLTLEILPWVKFMTHPWVMDYNCVKYYSDPIWQWGVMARKLIFSICSLWPWTLWYDLGSRS